VDTLKRTPLSEEYGRYGARMVDFAGWYMPIEFKGILQEHQAVRTGAGIFDVSHMGEITVKGNDALAFTDYLITNDARKLSDNQVLYTFLCREDGGIVDDILVYRFAADDFLLVVNAAKHRKGPISGYSQTAVDLTLKSKTFRIRCLSWQSRDQRHRRFSSL